MPFSLSSSSFKNGEKIPAQHTCDGSNVSPALSWTNPPNGTESFALIVDDPDAPWGIFNHWVLFNIPKSTTQLPEGVPSKAILDNGAVQGKTSFNTIGYGGPCPPTGPPHNYRFHVYALDTILDLKAGASRSAVLNAIKNHVLGEAELTAKYSRAQLTSLRSAPR
ncbi:MAG: YbhB/YbcL family Raf kinase inhibitor-like protein [Thaumarchaeota archaeon]|nr:YbhB/YbcL family Raf kinase inhibitor-like protein [Nitrososphaerota archaeon]MCL5317456.1 YbhB/YbcL family Raf kinase inhibitor-like protein [Nitrososphaerota archaeon]